MCTAAKQKAKHGSSEVNNTVWSWERRKWQSESGGLLEAWLLLTGQCSSRLTCQGLTPHISCPPPNPPTSTRPPLTPCARPSHITRCKPAPAQWGLGLFTRKSNQQEKYDTLINKRWKGCGSFNPCASKLCNIDQSSNVCFLLFTAW